MKVCDLDTALKTWMVNIPFVYVGGFRRNVLPFSVRWNTNIPDRVIDNYQRTSELVKRNAKYVPECNAVKHMSPQLAIPKLALAVVVSYSTYNSNIMISFIVHC